MIHLMVNVYKRALQKSIENAFFSGKALIVVGPRQVGKTTLCKAILKKQSIAGKTILELNGDNPTDREKLTNKDQTFLIRLADTFDIIFIDEGQKVTTIGQTLKILVDHYGDKKQILVTGSSSFNLLNMTTEPLTGRKRVFHLYPLSFSELLSQKNRLDIQKELDEFLIYGLYPDIINKTSFPEKTASVQELAQSALYKDILEFQLVKSSETLTNLLIALALQVGSEVSYTEIASLLSIDKNTVERYVDLLEKNFVIFRLPPYFTNKRKEISKMKKIYFADVGIRNALISNFSPLHTRSDKGALWENLMIVERIKYNAYRGVSPRYTFWRTRSGSEIDFIEEYAGALDGYEMKSGTPKKSHAPLPWKEYPKSTFSLITPDSYEKFLGLA